jgi:hypothetical protein
MSVFSNTKGMEIFLSKIAMEGFVEIPLEELEKTLKRLDIKIARNKQLDRTFVFANSENYKVIVRTTIDHKTGKLIPSGEDSGWVIIVDGDNKLISSPQIKRSTSFYKTLFFFCRVFKYFG